MALQFNKYIFLFCLFYMKFVSANEILNFPNDFLFGVASASYQVEGAWKTKGKGENVWDHYAHNPKNIQDGSNGDIACDSYHKYKEDAKLIKDLGLDVYRFSLSWSRILPTGFASQINPDGIRYYNDLIDELLLNGIQPFVTLFHWDLPQPLLDLGGWANPLMVNYYNDFANISFHYFGNRVKYWITFNEPFSFCGDGYEYKTGPPAVDLRGIGIYLCAHTVLKAHALTYRTYKTFYENTHGGEIGIVIDSRWYEPKTNTTEDIEAAYRALEFSYGWFINPIINGDYPDIMRKRIANFSKAENFLNSRLPEFTNEEKVMLQGSYDFLGLNHYSTSLIKEDHSHIWQVPSYYRDVGVVTEYDPNWVKGTINWLYDVPWGMYKILKYIRDKYNNPSIYITENGFTEEDLQDNKRIHYLKGYLKSVSNAIRDGCNVRSYITWSIMDNFEWNSGYTQKFGLYSVDFTNISRPRIPRASVKWFKEFVQSQRQSNDVNVVLQV